MAKFKFNTQKKKRKLHIFSLCDDAVQRANAARGHIEMFSNKEINIEGCCGVIDYSETFIKLKLKKGNITLLGNDLCINLFEDNRITVKGIINSVEFCI